MLRRSKRLASLILVVGLGLGVVGCGNKKVDETNKEVLTTMSKNDVEETENKENNNETLKEEVTETIDSTTEQNTNNSLNNNQSETKPSTNSSSSSKPSANKKLSNSSSSSNKPSTTTKPSNSSSSSSKPSTTTKPSNSSSSSNKPSTTTKPSNSSSSSSKPSANKKPSTSSSSNSKPSTTKPSNSSNSSSTRTWQYMSSLSKETFNALNEFRKANGVATLKYSSSEQSRANSVAEECAKNSYIRHDLMQISLGNEIGTPSSFINQWSNSSSHRNSMLESAFVEGAVSVYKDSKGYYYVVASFGDGW